ncbi:MAG: hypothetical protein KGM24_05915 [Elusimicrobia bacterium]|nr:hypothetical protein [Elusimicrobiota bacterium]
MNMLSAVVGLESRLKIGGAPAASTLLIAVLSLAGLCLLAAACRALGRCRQTHAARYTSPRR